MRYKQSARDSLATLAQLVRRPGPELGDRAWTACLMVLVIAGALWTHAQPVGCHTRRVQAVFLRSVAASYRLLRHLTTGAITEVSALTNECVVQSFGVR